jgi:hypothetical protein
MKLFLTGCALVVLTARADAACTYPTFDFFPEKNGSVVVEMKVTDGTSCTHNFAEGPGYKFTSVGIGLPPEHGALKKEGKNRFVYRPAAGFKGNDAYMMQICATKGAAKGCSSIAYLATVE